MKRLLVSTLVTAAAFVTACHCQPPPSPTPDPSRSTVAVDRPTGAVADGMDRVQITVTVRDTAGHPVAGVTVQLAASGTGNTLVPPAGPTDASGVATGTLATTVAESKTISASIPQGAIPSTATATFNAVATGVTGTRIIHYVGQDGVTITDVPQDLSGTAIAAYAFADGGYAVYPGVGTDAGTFQIAGVPPGATYFLRFGPSYVETSARTVDLGFHQGGRPDVALNAPGTYQHTVASGLVPWTNAGGIDVDALQMTSAGADFYIWSLDQDALDGGAARPGDTSVDQLMTYDSFGFGIPLVDGSKGDVTYLNQLQFQDAGVIFGSSGAALAQNRLWSLVRSSGPLSVKLDAGETSLVSAALAPVPQVSLPVDWKISPSTPGSFGSYRAAVSPSASTFVWYQLLIDALPSSAYGFYGSTPDLMLFTLNDDVAINQPDPQRSLPYGDPFPASWARFAYVEAAFGMNYQAVTDAGTFGTGTTVSINGYDLLDSFATTPLVPKVTPITSPSIDGVSFFSDQTLASTTPTLQWSSPAVGTPTYYIVVVHRMDSSARSIVLYTASTQVRVPPGVFASGGYYFVTIEAVVSPSTSLQSAPFEQHWPRHSADSASGVIHAP